MVYTASAFNTLAIDVPSTSAEYKSLNTDDKLAVLWFAYREMGRSISMEREPLVYNLPRDY
jgi:hypothetical protein